MLWFVLFACTEPATEIELSGQVLTGLDSTSGAADVQVFIRDGNTDDYSETVTDEDGIFAVAAPANSVLHIELDGAEFVPTAFSALTGSSNVQIPVGSLWLRTPLDDEQLYATFDNCPEVDIAGGIIEGEVHFNVVQQSTESNLVAEEATVVVYEANGTTHNVCYLDDDGDSDADALQVGATGRFAAFGVPSGPITVGFTYEIDTLKIENFGYVFLPEEGVGPFYPALIDLP